MNDLADQKLLFSVFTEPEREQRSKFSGQARTCFVLLVGCIAKQLSSYCMSTPNSFLLWLVPLSAYHDFPCSFCSIAALLASSSHPHKCFPLRSFSFSAGVLNAPACVLWLVLYSRYRLFALVVALLEFFKHFNKSFIKLTNPIFLTRVARTFDKTSIRGTRWCKKSGRY